MAGQEQKRSFRCARRFAESRAQLEAPQHPGQPAVTPPAGVWIETFVGQAGLDRVGDVTPSGDKFSGSAEHRIQHDFCQAPRKRVLLAWMEAANQSTILPKVQLGAV